MQTSNIKTADPFEILDAPHPTTVENDVSWQERAWLIVFDTFVAVALLILLFRALPVGAASPTVIQPPSAQAPSAQVPPAQAPSAQAPSTQPQDQSTILTVDMVPFEAYESSHGLAFDGPIMYTISVTNRGLVTAHNVTVTLAIKHDPLLVQAPWNCDTEGCVILIEELKAGETLTLPLMHSIIVPAIVVDNEEDAYIDIAPPQVSVVAANSLPNQAPLIEERLVCRCLTVYSPAAEIRTTSFVYLPIGMGPATTLQ